MKKALIVALVIVGFMAWMPNMLNAAEPGTIGFTAKLGLDAIGETELEDETGDAKTGFSIAVEGLYNLESLQLGLGLSYLFARGIDEDWPEGKFSAIPIYAVANFQIAADQITPFLALQVGYSYLMMDSTMEGWFEDAIMAEFGVDADVSVEGGLYWAIGGGIIFSNNVQVELLYRSHSGKVKGKADGGSESFDFSYTHITLSAGYRF